MTYPTKEKRASHTLAAPAQPYPDWSRFLKAVWQHGMSVKNADPVLIDEHVSNAAVSIKSSMLERSEAKRIRPSAFIACARQTYYAAKGEQSGEMPDNIGPTFAIGHLLHELSYAAVKAAMPKGFKVEVEKSVTMPTWWPDDYSRFNQEGHVDMFLTIEDDALAAVYLQDNAPRRMLVDFKTMGGYSFRKHGKTIWGEDPDGFGYLGQLSIYADSPDINVVDTGAIVAGINRDSLTQPLLPRFVDPAALKRERDRVKIATEMALEGADPGEEFLIRHDQDAQFFCGRAGKPGYCAFKQVCKDNPSTGE
jgi:hypothetical protein